jgi:hypothetical protein
VACAATRLRVCRSYAGALFRVQKRADTHVGHHAEDAAGSLLRRLLRPEIRRERSHLLQAFRFLSNAGCGAHNAQSVKRIW